MNRYIFIPNSVHSPRMTCVICGEHMTEGVFDKVLGWFFHESCALHHKIGAANPTKWLHTIRGWLFAG